MKKLFIATLICLNSLNIMAQDDARWMRNPSISPDGLKIVFSYHGNLYSVDSAGGNAVAISYIFWSEPSKLARRLI